jgi:hypothetical protein
VEIKDLKAGDKVALFCSQYSNSWYQIKTIDKVTPKGTIKIGESSFNPDGSKKNDNSSMFCELRVITPEITEAVKLQRIKAWVKKFNFSSLTDQQTLKLYSAMVKIIGSDL